NLPMELERNGKLQILDLGHNYIRLLSEIQVVGVLHELKNLNLRGNNVCEDREYQYKIKELLPNLQTLDGRPILSFKSHQKTRKRPSMGNNHEYISKDANDLSENLKACNIEGHEINCKRHSKKRKGEDKKGTKIYENDSDENKPFIKLITSFEKAIDPKIEEAATGKKRIISGDAAASGKTWNLNDSGDLPILKAKLETGVVSILEGDTKGNQPKGKIRKLGPMFLQNLRHVEIGTGGPSTWDPKTEENKHQAHQINTGSSSQNEYTFTSSSYSRWKLKGSRTDK
ncbi:hypothetical protein KI387_019308, partial [Taxus chinensis]